MSPYPSILLSHHLLFYSTRPSFHVIAFYIKDFIPHIIYIPKFRTEHERVSRTAHPQKILPPQESGQRRLRPCLESQRPQNRTDPGAQENFRCLPTFHRCSENLPRNRLPPRTRPPQPHQTPQRHPSRKRQGLVLGVRIHGSRPPQRHRVQPP